MYPPRLTSCCFDAVIVSDWRRDFGVGLSGLVPQTEGRIGVGDMVSGLKGSLADAHDVGTMLALSASRVTRV